jgi:hypothetical protein
MTRSEAALSVMETSMTAPAPVRSARRSAARIWITAGMAPPQMSATCTGSSEGEDIMPSTPARAR